MTTEKRDPVKYTVLERSLIGNRIYEEGETAEYDGLPAENLAPLCEVGRARYQEYLDSNKARVAKMMENHADSSVGDAAAFAKQFMDALAAANAAHTEQMAALQESMAAAIADGIAAALAAQSKATKSAPSKTAKGAASTDGTASTEQTEGAETSIA